MLSQSYIIRAIVLPVANAIFFVIAWYIYLFVRNNDYEPVCTRFISV